MTVRAVSAVLGSALAMSAFCFSAGVNAASGPGQPWILTLSWSPQYCSKHPISKEPQCTEGNYFLPIALSPERATGDDGKCPPAPDITQAQLDRLMPLARNRRELANNWLSEGGCTKLPFDQFAIRFDYATRHVIIPDTFRQLDDRLNTTAADIRDQFLQSNPGLKETQIALHCAGELSEVRICFNDNMSYRDCGASVKDDCKGKVKVSGQRVGRYTR